MASTSDAQGNPTATSTHEIFANFERLLSMTERIVGKLPGMSPAPVIESVPAAANAEASVPASGVVNHSWNTLGGSVFPLSPVKKPVQAQSEAGCSFAQWTSPSDTTPHIEHQRVNVALPHAVLTENQSLEEDSVETRAHAEGKGVNQLVCGRGNGRRQDKKIEREFSKEGRERFEESDTTLNGSTDRTWYPGTEVSISSCEYLEHSGTTTSRSDYKSEAVKKGAASLGGSATTDITRRSLRNSKRRRRSGRRRREGKSRNQIDGVVRREKSSLPPERSTSHFQTSQAISMPRIRMGKEKESFQAWKKPRGRGNPDYESDFQASPEARTQQNKKQEMSKRPRGMKKTATASVPELSLAEEVLQIGLRNEHQNTSQQLLNGSAVNRKAMVDDPRRELSSLVPQVLDKVNNAGREKRTAEAGKGREEPRNENRTPIQSVSPEEVFIQRPGKERERTPIRSPEWQLGSPPLSDRSGPHRRGRTMRRDYDATDFQDDADDFGGDERHTPKKNRRRRSVESSGSEDSESSQMARGRKRQRMSGGRHSRRDRSVGGRREGRRRHGRQECRNPDEENSSDSGAKRNKRHKRREQQLDVDIPRQSRRRIDSSDDEESSGSSAEEGRKKRTPVEGKAEDSDLESSREESRKRQDRRTRQGERETSRHNRERQGLKGHYITVNRVGVPYGFGVGAWKAELNKLCWALDPSITNIRYQREEDMATLRRRLKDSFEYSAPVDRAHIRALAGKYVTQRRSNLINSMKDGGECPTGLNREIWRRLDRMRQDPNREALSQRMKYANAVRVNKGRTGPKGENGIWEDLHRGLGREPDPEELEFEMRRKKGYGGASRRKRESKRIQRNLSVDLKADGNIEDGRDEEHSLTEKKSGADTIVQTCKSDMTLLLQMEQELEVLKQRMRAVNGNAESKAAEECGPSTSMQIRCPESNTTSHPVPNMMEAVPNNPEEANTEKGYSGRASPQKRKLRGWKKP